MGNKKYFIVSTNDANIESALNGLNEMNAKILNIYSQPKDPSKGGSYLNTLYNIIYQGKFQITEIGADISIYDTSRFKDKRENV